MIHETFFFNFAREILDAFDEDWLLVQRKKAYILVTQLFSFGSFVFYSVPVLYDAFLHHIPLALFHPIPP